MKPLHVSIFVACFVLGIFVRGFFVQDNTQIKTPKEKVVVEVKKEKVVVKEIENVKFLPKFIKKSLSEMGIDDKNLTKENWNIFLAKIKSSVFDDIAKKKEKDALLFKLISHKKIDIEKIAKLVKQGYDINAKNKLGETPLLVALRSIKNENDIEKIKKLVQLGANVNFLYELPENYENLQNFDVLNYALMIQNDKIRYGLMDYFESMGKSVEQNPERYLMFALYDEKYQDKIIDNIDMSIKTYKDYNVFEQVFPMLKNEKISEVLDNDNAIDYSRGTSILHQLSFNENISQDNIERILSLGLDINAKSQTTNTTPLQNSIMSENIKLTESFLKHGANPLIGDNINYIKNSEMSKENKKAFLDLLNKYKDRFVQ